MTLGSILARGSPSTNSILFASLARCSIFQLYAFIISPRRPVIAFFSILVSIITIAFVSTTISYDLDVDPINRRIERKFYGAVPNSSYKRTVTFFSMFAFTVISTAFKTVSCAFMAATSVPLFAFMIACEVGLGLLIKIVRGDYLYWFPLNGVTAYVISTIVRISTQICTGCTAMLELRHPQELGGGWWTITIIWTHLSAYSSVYAYHGGMNNLIDWFGGRFVYDGSLISSTLLYGSLSTLSICWFICGGVLLLAMKSEYWGTFFSIKTGSQFVCDKFRNCCYDDASKADCVLFVNGKLIADIRVEIYNWIFTNYEIWEQENPKWYTDNGLLLMNLPPTFIPEQIYTDIKRRNAFKLNKGRSFHNKMKTSAEIILLTTGRSGGSRKHIT